MDICICMAELLCYLPETITALLIGYTIYIYIYTYIYIHTHIYIYIHPQYKIKS